MTIPDFNSAGYSEAAAHVFTWLSDGILGGTPEALDAGRQVPASFMAE